MAIDPDVLARKAYQAYGDSTDWFNFLGEPMPSWEDLPIDIRQAWRAAAEVMRNG